MTRSETCERLRAMIGALEALPEETEIVSASVSCALEDRILFHDPEKLTALAASRGWQLTSQPTSDGDGVFLLTAVDGITMIGVTGNEDR